MKKKEGNYTVKEEDTLYALSKKFDISVEQIKSLNHLTSNDISIGQSLYLPKFKRKAYLVKKGDTLYSIAKKFDTTVEVLQQSNQLENNGLSIGQEIRIPKN